MSIAYRPAEERDRAFVVDSFLESYKNSHAAGLITLADWRELMGGQIKKVLARAGCEVFVAFIPGETDANRGLYGWLAVERGFEVPRRSRRRVNGQLRWTEEFVPSEAPLVHYVYVKQAYRRMGIARCLFKAAGIDPAHEFFYSCKTGVVSKLGEAIPKGRWNPLIARQEKRAS